MALRLPPAWAIVLAGLILNVLVPILAQNIARRPSLTDVN